MQTITLWDQQFTTYIQHERIQQRIRELGQDINRDYQGHCPLFLAILNGAFMFASDLFQNLCIDCEISFVKLSSYQGMRSSGEVQQLIGLEEKLANRHLIVLEDIVDSGQTLADLFPALSEQRPASIKVTSLLQKPAALQYNVSVDYLGFEIPNDFIVGYGLDYDGIGRNLRDIYQVVD